jgi:4'-phosphopantetheinyl transferase
MEWAKAKSISLPGEKHTHIWSLPAGLSNTETDPLLALLSASEKERASLIRSSRQQKQYIYTRGMLRKLLSTYTGIPANNLLLTSNEHGKPALDKSQNPYALQFNLSHSGNHCLMAFACDARVGIDIELIQKNREINKLAHRFFHVSEHAFLNSIEKKQQHKIFYRYWTIKESVLKAIGAGLQYGLDKVIVPDDKLFLDTFSLTINKNRHETWEVHQIPFTEDFLAAVALEGTGWKLEYYKV